MRFSFSLVTTLMIILTIGCAGSDSQPGSTTDSTTNPLLSEWDTPFGVPPFDAIQDDDYLPAFRAAMENHKEEIGAIINSSEPPTFANTIEALERSGKLLTRVSNVFFALDSAHSNDTIREVAGIVAPELAAHGDSITLNSDLYARVKAVYDRREELDLGAEQAWLLKETNKGFVRSGVGLDQGPKERLMEINAELAELSQKFGDNLLKETNDFELHVTDRADLGDLPESLVSAAAEEAKRRERDSGWLFTLQRPSINPFLQYSPNREMRKKLFIGYAKRGENGNDADNREILTRMAALRAERAKLLGYETHAHYILEDAMAETPERVTELLDRVWKPALYVSQKERADLQAMMREDGIEGDLMGWDWRYYSEKVRKARYDLDEQVLRPYFPYPAVRDGAFKVATKLFGLTFHEQPDLPRWHPDQEVFEMREADGTHIGIIYIDPYARESKRGGAWMNDLRSQSRLDGEVKPIVTNNFNFPPPPAEGPALLSYGDAETMFHEFGHGLHGLLSDVTYESLSGTNVPRDYVEFPSQVMENWMGEPEVLRMFARHYETGEAIPDELIEKLTAADKFNQGFVTVEYLAASYLDMAWHTLSASEKKDPERFENEEMQRIGLIEAIIPRYRSTYFAHIFSGGYASGYYSYLWSEVLDADAFQAFKETSLFDQEMARKYRKYILAMGGTRPGMELYESFRGRAPEIEPLLEKRGLNLGP
jgi:peptidyl-dipeptidase Dcp